MVVSAAVRTGRSGETCAIVTAGLSAGCDPQAAIMPARSRRRICFTKKRWGRGPTSSLILQLEKEFHVHPHFARILIGIRQTVGCTGNEPEGHLTVALPCRIESLEESLRLRQIACRIIDIAADDWSIRGRTTCRDRHRTVAAGGEVAQQDTGRGPDRVDVLHGVLIE